VPRRLLVVLALAVLVGCSSQGRASNHDPGLERSLNSPSAHEAFLQAAQQTKDPVSVHYEQVCDDFCTYENWNEPEDGDYIIYEASDGEQTRVCWCVLDRIADNGEDYVVEFAIEVPASSIP